MLEDANTGALSTWSSASDHFVCSWYCSSINTDIPDSMDLVRISNYRSAVSKRPMKGTSDRRSLTLWEVRVMFNQREKIICCNVHSLDTGYPIGCLGNYDLVINHLVHFYLNDILLWKRHFIGRMNHRAHMLFNKILNSLGKPPWP